MALDTERFHELFFEEAAEHLSSLETLALKLDSGQTSSEDVNAVFRAAHSIKGGAATFGFDRLAQMTHMLETVLDQVRQGSRALTAPLISLILDATDVLRAHVNALRSGGSSDAAAEAELLQRLEAESASDAAAAASTVAAQAVKPPKSTSVCIVEVRLDSAQKGSEEALRKIADDLTAYGAIDSLTSLQQAAQTGVAQFRLTANTPLDEVRESLAFVWDEDSFSIKPADAVVAASPLEQPATVSVVEKTEPSEAGNEAFGFFAENLPEALATTQGQAAFDPLIGRRAYDYGPDAAKFGRRSADRFVAQPMDSSSIRVSTEKVDRLVNLVGELVIAQAMLTQSASQANDQVSEGINTNLGQLDRNIRELHEAVMAIRMLPISYVFSRFPRVVRDLADRLHKKVELIVEGEETELDKGLIEKIADPLTHLVRNSIDHGLEVPEAREAVGKPPIGTLRVRASHEGGNIVIEVSDDGIGFNRARLLKKAAEIGIALADNVSDEEVWQLALLPGLSTAQQVTDVSGRGVGMDVVKRNIEQLGGRLSIQSAAGMGSAVTIRLPLTLAILDGMLVTLADHTYVISLGYILENLRQAEGDVKTITGQGRVVRVRDEYIPLVVLHEVLNVKARRPLAHEAMLVICEANGQRAALQVDDLVSQGQFVIKSLEQNYRKVPGIAGATILGDGKVALILDVGTLLRTGRQRAEHTPALAQ